MQYFFVDESGDAGLTNQGSAYYVVAMVQLPNREPLVQLSALRDELYLSPNFEFHYYKMNSRQKDEFFQAVHPLAFRVRAAALIKSRLPLKSQSMSSTELATSLLVSLTLRASPLDIANDVLVLDSAPDSFVQSLRIQFTQAYQREGRERPFKKIVSSRSKYDDGLQLADMMAGAVRESIWENDSTYFRTFSNKVLDLWRADK
ncbi:MAG: hypothetical protein DCC56_05740 [Anaerolineae bacterium]|nr:MAG: hypothetical protein DCC56_05740 [Anaerolineae bacterium]WKZ43644.1 MAG: DUF3800 domain-containing protein [Anaerolineales bacterium]